MKNDLFGTTSTRLGVAVAVLIGGAHVATAQTKPAQVSASAAEGRGDASANDTGTTVYAGLLGAERGVSYAPPRNFGIGASYRF